MGILEITTTNTDSKVDTILNKLDSWDIPTKRRGVTTNMEERSAPTLLFRTRQGRWYHESFNNRVHKWEGCIQKPSFVYTYIKEHHNC